MSGKNEVHFTPAAYDSREKCLEYLCELKWGKGFQCRTCGHRQSIKGKAWYYRKCQSCKKEESFTAHTLFHKIKFPLTTAFAIVYQLSSLRKGMSCCQISKQYNIHIQTAWYFRAKVQLLMSGKRPLNFSYYMKHSVKLNNLGSKNTIIVRLESNSNKKIKTKISGISTNMEQLEGVNWGKERWSAMRGKNYRPRKSKKCSEIELNFRNSDRHYTTQMYLLNMKNWISGVHHFVSMRYLERYLREFQYRYDRRDKQSEDSMEELLCRMVKSGWHSYCSVKAN